MDLKEIELEDLDRIPLAKDMYNWRADVNTAMELRVSYNAGNSFTIWYRISVSSRRKFPWRRYIKHKGTETRGYSATLNVKTTVNEYICISVLCRLLNKMAVSLAASVTWSNSKMEVRRPKGQARQHKQHCSPTLVLHPFIRQNVC